MLAARTRSGLDETTHDGAVAAADADGDIIASFGDIDRPFYMRSAAKPFQAFVVQREGAGLGPVELAVSAASHDGDPVHVAIVESMLADGGLSPSDLGCPADWPEGAAAKRAASAAGHAIGRRVWHTCSGKHASWLRVSRSRSWPIDSYLSADHPLQHRIIETVSELGGFDASPVGVDGCGAPVLRTTTRAMAVLFSRLAVLEELRPVFDVMHRYPALISGTGNGDAAIATALNAAAKRGAQGCVGVAVDSRLGVAAKSWDGRGAVADVAAIAALDSLGELGPTATAQLAVHARPMVKGGVSAVGEMQPRFEMNLSQVRRREKSG